MGFTPCACDGERLRTFFHSDYFRTIERHEEFELNDEKRAILEFYDTKAMEEGVSLDMDLEKGDIQLISNLVTIHAQTPYIDSPAAKRHLLSPWLSLKHCLPSDPSGLSAGRAPSADSPRSTERDWREPRDAQPAP